MRIVSDTNAVRIPTIPNLCIENKIYGPYIDAIMRLEMREIGEDGNIGADKSTFLRFV